MDCQHNKAVHLRASDLTSCMLSHNSLIALLNGVQRWRALVTYYFLVTTDRNPSYQFLYLLHIHVVPVIVNSIIPVPNVLSYIKRRVMSTWTSSSAHLPMQFLMHILQSIRDLHSLGVANSNSFAARNQLF